MGRGANAFAEEVDPYAPPTSALVRTRAAVELPSSDPEAVRRRMLHTETAVRNTGLFAILGGIVLSLVSSTLAILLHLEILKTRTPDFWQWVAVFLTIFGFVAVWSGIELRRLSDKARWLGTIVGLIAVWLAPAGTILGLYGLNVIWSTKGRFVTTEEYRVIRRQTPYVRHRTLPFHWIVAFIALVIVLAAVLVENGML